MFPTPRRGVTRYLSSWAHHSCRSPFRPWISSGSGTQKLRICHRFWCWLYSPPEENSQSLWLITERCRTELNEAACSVPWPVGRCLWEQWRHFHTQVLTAYSGHTWKTEQFPKGVSSINLIEYIMYKTGFMLLSLFKQALVVCLSKLLTGIFKNIRHSTFVWHYSGKSFRLDISLSSLARWATSVWLWTNQKQPPKLLRPIRALHRSGHTSSFLVLFYADFITFKMLQSPGKYS